MATQIELKESREKTVCRRTRLSAWNETKSGPDDIINFTIDVDQM